MGSTYLLHILAIFLIFIITPIYGSEVISYQTVNHGVTNKPYIKIDVLDGAFSYGYGNDRIIVQTSAPQYGYLLFCMEHDDMCTYPSTYTNDARGMLYGSRSYYTPYHFVDYYPYDPFTFDLSPSEEYEAKPGAYYPRAGVQVEC